MRFVKESYVLYLGLISVVYIQVLIFLGHGLSTDEKISDYFFTFPCQAENSRQCWSLDKSDQSLTFLLHHLPVHIFTGIGILSFCIFAASFRVNKLRKYRELSFLLILAIGVVPGVVALLKIYTGHYCPGQLPMYGGPVGVADLKQPRPRCFPAGFPSSGFGLLVLYFGTLPVFWRRLGLYGGLGIGGILSMIQIARGEHFLSHCLATLSTALFIGLVVYSFRRYYQGHYHAFTGG